MAVRKRRGKRGGGVDQVIFCLFFWENRENQENQETQRETRETSESRKTRLGL